MENANPVNAALNDQAAPKSPAKAKATKATKAKPAKSAKPAKKVAKATKAAKPAAREDGKIPLKEICAKLDVEPKAARVKLRRNADKLSFHDRTDRWVFTPAQAAKVREILSA